MTDETATDVAPPPAPERWGIVEVMGHRRRAGRVSEVGQFGVPMLRVEVPIAGQMIEEFYSGASIFCFTPCSEERARADVDRNLYAYQGMAALPAPPMDAEFDEIEVEDVDGEAL